MKKVTLEEAQSRIKIRFPEENFKIISYTSLSDYGEIECLQCHEIIKINRFGNFFAKSKAYGCKNCHGLWRQREEKIKKIEEKYNIIDTFVKNTHTYYHVKCKNCGHERTTTLNNFIKNLNCGCSTGVFRNRTPVEFIKEVNNFQHDDYELVGEYKNQITKVLIRHVPCGFIREIRPADLLSDKIKCPKCDKLKSNGENIICKILTKMNINYLEQVSLKDSLQKFDFFLPEQNIAIEYNGKQHYQYIDFFHKNQEGFEKQLERDKNKRQYCIDNNIYLIEIPYTMSIEEIGQLLQNEINSTTKVGQAPEKAASLTPVSE